MSLIPMGGRDFLPNPELATQRPDSYLGMGLSAERLAEKEKVSREDQDAFALESHRRALAALEAGTFDDEITPVTVRRTRPQNGGTTLSDDSVEFKRTSRIFR